MRRTGVAILTVASLALSLRQVVRVHNALDSTVLVELRQYWPTDDGYTGDSEPRRPALWTDDHLIRTVERDVLAGGEDEIEFEGGGWVVRRVEDGETGRLRCEGEVDSTSKLSDEIAIDRARCGELR